MNRSEFLKKLGLGVIVAAVAPKVLAEVKEEPKLTAQEYHLGNCKAVYNQWKPVYEMDYTPAEYLKYYKRTGDLPYRIKER